MSWNTSSFLESVNGLMTVISSGFEVDSDEAGEAYIMLRDDLKKSMDQYDIDIIFEMLVYTLTLTTLSLDSKHTDFKSFWQQYLLCLEEASDDFLLGSCGDVEAILPYLRTLMSGDPMPTQWSDGNTDFEEDEG